MSFSGAFLTSKYYMYAQTADNESEYLDVKLSHLEVSGAIRERGGTRQRQIHRQTETDTDIDIDTDRQIEVDRLGQRDEDKFYVYTHTDRKQLV